MIAVLFEADALTEAQERYLQLASELKPLLSHTPGFSTHSMRRKNLT